jgi:glycosyltransferase involved in cell wall biosynthesis
MVIVDDFSNDRTIEVIKSLKQHKTEIYQREIDGDFAAQRNFGIEKAKEEWIFFVDADERVTPDLRREINDILIDEKNKPLHNGFYVKRSDYIWGKELKYGETGSIKLLRLAKKNKGKWIGTVHEGWQVEGNLGELDFPLLHYPHQSISQFLDEINFYTDLRASQLYKEGVNIRNRQIILYPLGKFLLNFIVKFGFLDGIRGLIFALMMSFHSFLVRAKLWSLWRIN